MTDRYGNRWFLGCVLAALLLSAMSLPGAARAANLDGGEKDGNWEKWVEGPVVYDDGNLRLTAHFKRTRGLGEKKGSFRVRLKGRVTGRHQIRLGSVIAKIECGDHQKDEEFYASNYNTKYAAPGHEQWYWDEATGCDAEGGEPEVKVTFPGAEMADTEGRIYYTDCEAFGPPRKSRNQVQAIYMTQKNEVGSVLEFSYRRRQGAEEKGEPQDIRQIVNFRGEASPAKSEPTPSQPPLVVEGVVVKAPEPPEPLPAKDKAIVRMFMDACDGTRPDSRSSFEKFLNEKQDDVRRFVAKWRRQAEKTLKNLKSTCAEAKRLKIENHSSCEEAEDLEKQLTPSRKTAGGTTG